MLNSLMARLQVRVNELKDREDGQGLIEYSLMAAFLAIVSILILEAIGIDVASVFDVVDNAIGGSDAGAPGAADGDPLTP